MDSRALKNAMKVSISEVLETMFFMPLEEAEIKMDSALLQTPLNKLACARLIFQGPFSGEVIFLLPHTLAYSLTADFMGQDPNETGPEDMEGTLKELLNMICGKMLSLYDSKAVFKLGIPEKINLAEPLHNFLNTENDAINLIFDTMEEQLALHLALR